MDNRFEIVRPLGKGGQGQVFLVRDHRRLGRLVALKRVGQNKERRAELALEFDRLAGLRHPSLARAYDFGEDDEGPYFTSEFVDGKDVISWSRDAKEEEILTAMASVLRALQLLHDRDLVHGDVSPANLLVATDTPLPIPKLLDLGGARKPGQPGTTTTPGFAPPEVLTGRGVLTASDLYSFGVLLALVLYGKNPFGEGDASSIVKRQLKGEADLPDPALSPVAGLCRDLIHKDPALRPKSATDTLERFAEVTGLAFKVDISELLGGDLPAPKIVGRGPELASLTALIDWIENADGERVARIEGPLGSGRSTMLAEAVREAQLAGMRVIGYAGGPLTADALLSGLVNAAKQERLSQSTLRSLAPWIAPQSRQETGQSPEAVGYAAQEALMAASEQMPILVAIDDLQASGQLVRMVATTLARALAPGRSARPRAMLVATGDPTGFDARWQSLSCHQIALKPLDAQDTVKLVSSMLPGVGSIEDLAENVYLASKGWPGKAEQFVRQAMGQAGGGDLLARTQALVKAASKEAKVLLALLSMVDEPVPPGLLGDVGGRASRLDDLVKSGFLVEVRGPDGPGMKVAAQAGLAAFKAVPLEKTQAMATRLARALEQDGRLKQAAHLWDRAGEKEAAYHGFGTLARQCLERGDLADAGEWFEEALNRVSKEKEAGPLAKEAVDVWRLIGKVDLALKELDRAHLKAIERARLKAELTLDKGNHQEALDLARQGLGDHPGDLTLLGVVAAAELQLGRSEQCFGTVQSALKDKRPGKNTGTLARLAQIGGLACTYLGRLDEAASLFDKAALDFEKQEDIIGQLKVSANRGLLQRRRGDLEKARSSYNRAVALALDLGDRPRQGLHLMNRATIAQILGDIAAAHEDYLASLDIAVVLGNRFAQAQVEVNLGDLLTGIGDHKAALDLSTKAKERCLALGQERLAVRAVLTAGIAMLRAGALSSAEHRLSEARRKFAAGGDDVGRMIADLHLAEFRLCKGDPNGAMLLAKETAALAKDLGRTEERARALVLLARAMANKGDRLEEALLLLEEAEHLISEASLPDELWRMRCHMARILDQAGKQARAQDVRISAENGLQQVLQKVPAQYKETFLGWGEARELAGPDLLKTKPAPSDRRMRNLERLMEVNREMTREHDPKRLLSLIMEHAVELTGAERGMVIMPKDDKLEQVISHMISDETDVSFSRSVAEQVVAEGRAVLAIDAMGDERFRAFVSVHTMKLRSILAVPLRIRHIAVGVIYLDSRLRTGVFSDDDRQLLEAFGAQAAISLETARLISENAKRCSDLEGANEEIKSLSVQLEEKLERNEAKLRRVGALLQKTQTDEAERLKESGIVGRALAMQQVMRMIDRIALTDVPVYIYGASGTGKELVARAIHGASERRENPFVPVNCGALPSKLLASELFGYTKGAFTGAVGDRPGLFRLADKGTLFLDEMTDMDPEMQAHLLRVLQDGTFRALGGTEEIKVDVRILSASNRDLDEEVKAGRFREDLFYRLNVVRVDVPPLSERREDIPLLVDFFKKRHTIDESHGFSKEAIDLLVSADWPGNVRELENEVLRALTMATPGQPIEPNDLSPRLHGGTSREAWSTNGSLKNRVDSFERAIIQRILQESGGNATKAAKLLGISRAGLYKKLDKHGINR